ncbi:MAG: discoidin domain-containing protein [Prevotellamassilia sp.]|nr:discoidin domain-containing protein [Prevotellamassilia sp.]
MGKTPSLRLALLAILFAPLLALVAEAAALTELTEGKIYRITNKADKEGNTLYLTPNSNNVATAQEEITDGADGYLTQYWYVYRVNTAGKNPNYTLRNVGNGKFLKGAGMIAGWTLVDEAFSTTNLYFISAGTYNTFSVSDDNSTSQKDKMYAASLLGYRVVGWSTDADATSWTFTETTNAAATAAVALLAKKDALTNKIAEAKSYINLQVLTPTANGYLFCNDPYLGNNDDYSPQDKGYNLIDGITATHFHSNYASNKKPLEDQWIRVTYPTGISTFTFNYTNRNTGWNTWNTYSHIKTMVVEGSVDDVTYTPIKEYTAADNLPSNALGTYSSGTLGSADKVYKYLRFRVTSTYQNAAFYYIAELSVTRSNLSSAESDAIATLRSDITTAEAALSNATTAEAYTEATNTLNTAIATYSSTMESVYAAQAAKDKELLKEKIDQLNNEYVGNNGFLESVSGSTYNWQSKYEADKSSLTELVDRMRIELRDANAAYKGTNLAAYNTHITQCEALTLEAQEVKFYNYSLPVKMSTAEATYYYSIHEKGTEDKVWQYNTSTKDDSWTDGYCANKVKLLPISAGEMENGVEIGNPRHAFYFKRGAKIPEVYIYNAHDGYRLCATSTDFAEGAGKAKFLKESTESETNSDFDNASCRSWEIIANGDYYNLRGIATDENNTSKLYAAHVASHTNNLGFSTDASADIAKFSFKINKYPNKTCPYYVLRNYFNTQLKMWWVDTTNELGFPAAITLKDEQHTVTDNFNEAFQAADLAFKLNVPTSDADIQRIYEKLKKYNEALTMYVPTEATYYTFNSGLSALSARSLAIDPTTCALSATTGMVKTVDDKTTEHTQALWLLTPVPGKVNTFTMQNVHTGLYVQSFAGGTLSMGEEPAEIVLASRNLTTGQFAFTATDASTYVLTAAEADGAVSAAEQAAKPAADAADCWTATKVSDLTTVQHPVSITPYGKAGFYSSHEVTLPAEIQAWYMKGTTQVDGDGVTRITMTKVDPETDGTTILPKETPVLLVTPTAPAATTTYNLTYSTTTKAAVEGNKLSGVAYSQAVEGTGSTCYKFGVANDIAALYPMFQEYNASGELTNAGTNEGGYIKASANKIYLKLEGSQGASRLEFRFTDPTTGIEQIITDTNGTTPPETYYDLQGRRIQGRPAGGIYIVNGVKRLIRR